MSYGCELYAGQLRAGDDYLALRLVFSICLLDGVLWDDSPKVHHAFRLSDRESGRSLERTLEIHTLELGKYNLSERDMATASPLDQWLYWLRHAQEYEAADLLRLFPQAPIIQATRTSDAIAAITEDKTMYDSRKKPAATSNGRCTPRAWKGRKKASSKVSTNSSARYRRFCGSRSAAMRSSQASRWRSCRNWPRNSKPAAVHRVRRPPR